MVSLLPNKKTPLEKINPTFVENNKSVALPPLLGSTHVVEIKPRAGSFSFGVSEKKAKPCLGH